MHLSFRLYSSLSVIETVSFAEGVLLRGGSRRRLILDFDLALIDDLQVALLVVVALSFLFAPRRVHSVSILVIIVVLTLSLDFFDRGSYFMDDVLRVCVHLLRELSLPLHIVGHATISIELHCATFACRHGTTKGQRKIAGGRPRHHRLHRG